MRYRNVCILLLGMVLGASTIARAQAPGQSPGGRPPGGPPGTRPPQPLSGTPSGGPGSSPPNGSNGGGGTPGGRPASVTTSTGVKLGPPGRWWDDKTYVQTIGLSRDQQKKMDTIFDANKPAIIQTYKTLEQQKANQVAVSKDTTVDQARMFAAIDSVNQARSALEKANTQMLLQIRQQLTPTQIVKIDGLP